MDWGQAMKWMFADRTSVFPGFGRSFGRVSVFVAFLVVAAVSLAPAHAIQIPSDGEQDVLIRTTLMTFNDANMTGNYAVLLAKASRQFQSQITAQNSRRRLRRSGPTSCFSKAPSARTAILRTSQRSIRKVRWCWWACSRPTTCR